MSDGSDYDDVEWEEEDGDNNSIADSIDISNDDINIVLNQASNSNSKPKKKAVVFTNEDYEKCQTRHQNHLLQLIRNAKRVTFSSSEKQLQLKMKSLLPKQLIRNDSNNITNNNCADINYITDLHKWFRRSFTPIPGSSMSSDEGRDGSSNGNDLLLCIERHSGSNNQLTQLFCSLLLCLGFRVRLVRTIDPKSFLPKDYPKLYAMRWKEINNDNDTEKNNNLMKKLRKTAKLPPILSWLEVYIKDNITTLVNRKSRSAINSSNTTKSKVRVVDLCSEDENCSSSAAVSSNDKGTGCKIKSTKVINLVTDEDDQSFCLGNDKKSDSRASEGRWVHVDLNSSTIDCPTLLEESHRRGRALYYVIGAEYIGGMVCNSKDRIEDLIFLKDLTKKYNFKHCARSQQFNDTKQFIDDWLHGVLMSMNSQAADTLRGFNQSSKYPNKSNFGGNINSEVSVIDLVDSDDGNVSKRRRFSMASTEGNSSDLVGNSVDIDALTSVCEDVPDKQLSLKHPMPTSLSTFKDHPIYLLERHLKSDEVLHPNFAHSIGMCKGERVYLQAHRETLRSRRQWRRCMRQIRADVEPVRVVKRSIRNSESSGDRSSVEIKLYGSWQTEPIKIEPVRNGVIPVNEHGNIEIWDGDHRYVPDGAVFIESSAALRTCRQLSLPHAPAITGFDRRSSGGGDSVIAPRISGVVVLHEHSQLIMEAIDNIDTVREEESRQKRERCVLRRWKNLVLAALTRQSLRERYGH